MFRTIHPIAGALALLTVCTFWLSTAYSELTGDLDLIVLGHAHIPLLHEAAPSRFYINLRYKGIRNLTLEARYARLFWSRGGNIGTGLDATGEPTRTELAAQIKWSF